MVLFITLVGAFLSIIVILFTNIMKKGGGFSFPWVQFYLRGKESGFHFQEISTLHQLVKKTRIRDPLSVFWSTKSILNCIANVVSGYQQSNTIEDRQSALFLRKLYIFVNKTEYKKRARRRGLRSTREISVRQALQFYPTTKETRRPQSLQSHVVAQQSRYLAIAHPSALKSTDAESLKLTGERVRISFRYKDDGQYTFFVRILGSFQRDDVDILHITHSRKLIRQQLRKDTRRTLNISGQIFLISSQDDSMVETHKDKDGYRCQVVDISEGGAAVIVGGHLSNGQHIRLQFTYKDMHIVYVAQVLYSRGDEEKNLVMAHLKTLSSDAIMRNRISGIIYDIPSIILLNEERLGRRTPSPVLQEK